MRQAVVAVALAALLAASAAAQERKLKVYISVDMEGVAGAVTGEQLGPAGFEYQRFREFMTGEALAAIEAARRAGATEILVSDSHGNGQNLLIERFPSDVTIVRAWPRPQAMMEGIDATFDAAILIGYHASTHSPRGVRAHTFSSAYLTGVSVNGAPASEALLSAAIAGHYGVPIVAISGDAAAVEEAQAQIGPVEGAIVKWDIGFHSARTLTPEAAYARIGEAVARGLARRAELRPFRVAAPVTFELRFKHYRPAEVFDLLPNVERTGSHSIRFVGRDILEVIRFLQFAMHYEPGLAP
jgi:D-amino peptidase